jgi:hypothetical protein
MSEDLLDVLLHEWTIIAQHDGGYVLGRCRVCGQEDLLDVDAATGR